MTPAERLAEIENDWNEYLVDPVNTDIKWLITRVKKLTEALESQLDSRESTAYFYKLTASKALDEE